MDWTAEPQNVFVTRKCSGAAKCYKCCVSFNCLERGTVELNKMEESAEAMSGNLSLDDKTKQMLDNMTEWENLGQSIITGKRTMVELDERRQKCREALRQLHKANSSANKKRKNWVCFGSTTFLKVTIDQTKQMIEDDMKVIGATLNEARESIKNQVDKLKKMENCKSLVDLGFSLDRID